MKISIRFILPIRKNTLKTTVPSVPHVTVCSVKDIQKHIWHIYLE